MEEEPPEKQAVAAADGGDAVIIADSNNRVRYEDDSQEEDLTATEISKWPGEDPAAAGRKSGKKMAKPFSDGRGTASMSRPGSNKVPYARKLLSIEYEKLKEEWNKIFQHLGYTSLSDKLGKLNVARLRQFAKQMDGLHVEGKISKGIHLIHSITHAVGAGDNASKKNKKKSFFWDGNEFTVATVYLKWNDAFKAYMEYLAMGAAMADADLEAKVGGSYPSAAHEDDFEPIKNIHAWDDRALDPDMVLQAVGVADLLEQLSRKCTTDSVSVHKNSPDCVDQFPEGNEDNLAAPLLPSISETSSHALPNIQPRQQCTYVHSESPLHFSDIEVSPMSFEMSPCSDVAAPSAIPLPAFSPIRRPHKNDSTSVESFSSLQPRSVDGNTATTIS